MTHSFDGSVSGGLIQVRHPVVTTYVMVFVLMIRPSGSNHTNLHFISAGVQNINNFQGCDTLRLIMFHESN